MTNENFIERALLVPEHQGKNYGYERVNILNSYTKVEIICPDHGSFWQSPTSHLDGHGCIKCKDNSKRYTTEEFIKISKLVPEHQGKNYDYNPTIYINCITPVIIICPIHKEFKVIPQEHMTGKGCPCCKQEEIRLQKEKEFIEKSKKHPNHKDKNYGYHLVYYQGCKIPVTIVFQKHGPFEQTPNAHRNGYGCQKCADDSCRSSREEFIRKALLVPEHQGKNYGYEEVEYINSNTPVTIICPKHGRFKQRPGAHTSGIGCPRCNDSKGEKAINDWLSLNKLIFYRQIKFKDCRHIYPLSFDFGIYDESNNLIGLIEFNGQQHYKAIDYFGGEEKLKITRKRDSIKKNYCKNNNIPLLVIPHNRIKSLDKYLKEFTKKEITKYV